MTTLYKGKYLTLLEQQGWEYVDRPASYGVVAVVAVFHQSLLLVEQFRWSQGMPVISLPGGLVEERTNDLRRDLENAARRELLEETGFTASEMKPIVTGPISPGMTTENVTIFLAKDVRQVMEPKGDGDEVIKASCVPMNTIFQWLNERQNARALIDLKVYFGLALVGHTP